MLVDKHILSKWCVHKMRRGSSYSQRSAWIRENHPARLPFLGIFPSLALVLE